MNIRYRNCLLLLLIVSICFSTSLLAQDSVVLSGIIKNNTKYDVILLEKFGIGSYPIFKTNVDRETGRFSISLSPQTERGIYRLRYSMTNAECNLDIIIDTDKHISFEIDATHPELPPVFHTSRQNTDWYTYRYSYFKIVQKISVLDNLIKSYPDKKSKVYMTTLKDREVLATSLAKLRAHFISRNSNAVSGKVELQRPIKLPNPEEPYQLQAYKMWSEYWSGISAVDTSLINTPLYTEHIISYLQYWVDKNINFDDEEKKEGFKKSVDTLMKVFGANRYMRNFATLYLQKGFREINEEFIVQYIDEKYQTPDICSNENENRSFEQRLASYKLLSKGKPAPKIFVTNLSGVEQEYIKNAVTDTLIIAFWASWCTHCSNVMPLLDSVVASRKNITVLAVSIDTDATAYANSKLKLKNIEHYCDYSGWDSKPVRDYAIVATPTFYMIDKDRFILEKYTSIESLFAALKVLQSNVNNLNNSQYSAQ